jgi:hypothetical protein
VVWKDDYNPTTRMEHIIGRMKYVIAGSHVFVTVHKKQAQYRISTKVKEYAGMRSVSL